MRLWRIIPGDSLLVFEALVQVLILPIAQHIKGITMKRLLMHCLLATVALLAITPTAFAQATRTWVSGVGDDANPCSRTAPCKTWPGAIAKTAAGGEIDALDPGGFGALTITKAITIDGGGGQVASTLVSGTNGFIISAGATDVVILRNLRLTGISQSVTPGLNGIRFLSGAQLIIDNCEIFGFSQNGIDVALNQSTNANIVVHNTNLSLIGGIGINFANTSTGTVLGSLSNVAIRDVASGVATNSSSISVDMSNSSINFATGFGLHAVLGSISAESSMISGNLTAIRSENGATVRLANDGIYNNSIGIKAVGTGAVLSAGNNRNAGNSTVGAPTGAITIQ